MDPSPRQYPTLVALMRRLSNGPSVAPTRATCAQIREWLLSEAVGEEDLLPLLEQLVWRMAAAGLPVDRVTVHIGTLHPQLLGFYWYWDRIDGMVDELKVDQGGFGLDRYRRSPLAVVIRKGETFRARTDDPKMAARYPILAELEEQGFVDYTAFPMGSGNSTYHNSATLATRRDSGFDDAGMHECREIFRIFALHVERQIARRIAVNVLDTYLGTAAGEKVLSGSIRRGEGESIRAVIWMSDLRGYSSLTDRLPGPEVLVVLNEYFERLAGAVIAHGGQILKFIGDGLLAVFPIDEDNDERTAASSAAAAAEQAMLDIDRLNREAPEVLDRIDGWRPLRSGIALHLGEVFFGNMGAPERLDFTVIGRAVNEVSRVEALTKELGVPVLVSEPVAGLLDRELEDMGRHELRGFSGRMPVFAVPVPPARSRKP